MKETAKQRIEVAQPEEIVRKVEEIFKNSLKSDEKVEAIVMREVDNRLVFSVEVSPGIFAETNQDFSDELSEAVLNANSYVEDADKPRLKALLAQHYQLESLSDFLTKICSKN